MKTKILPCVSCGGFAPPKRNGSPLWASLDGPLCTPCACALWVVAHGGDPALAELRLIEAAKVADGEMVVITPDWKALSAKRNIPVTPDNSGLQLCAECGQSVAPDSVCFVNRVPLEALAQRLSNGFPFPEGAFMCAECDQATTVDCPETDSWVGVIPNFERYLDFDSELLQGAGFNPLDHSNLRA